MREGEAVQKSGGGQVGSLPALSEQRHGGKKTFAMKMLDLPGLNFTRVCTWVLTTGELLQCSGGDQVGKATAEDVMAPPLPLRAEAELTPGSY